MKTFSVYAAALALLCSSCGESGHELSVKSPDGKIEVKLATDSLLTYSVAVDGLELISPSRLGFDAEGLTPAADAKLSVTHSDFDETWTQPWGENKEIRNHYKEMAVTLTDSVLAFTVRVRAFDDGVAFRYEWEASGRDSVTVMD